MPISSTAFGNDGALGTSVSTGLGVGAVQDLVAVAGKPIVVAISGQEGGSITGVTDTLGNAYIQVVSESTFVLCQIWVCLASLGDSAANRITAAFATSVRFKAISAITSADFAASGLVISSNIGNAVAAQPVASGSMSVPAGIGALLFGVACSSNDRSWTPETGATEVYDFFQASGSSSHGSEYEYVLGGGTLTFSSTCDTATSNLGIAAVALRLGPQFTTFGDTTPGGSTFPATNDRAVMGQFVLTEDALVSSITVSFDTTSTAGDTYKGLIYSNSGGAPGSLLAVGAAVAVPAGGGQIVSTVTPFTLPAGTYWVGGVTSGFNTVYDADVGAGGNRSDSAQGMSYTTPPASFTSSGTTADRISAYVTYTPISALNQYLGPVSDVSAGTWSPSEGASLFGTIDEASYNEIDYNRTNNPAGGSFTVALQAGSDPYVSTGHIVRYAIAASTGSITVRLMQGAVEIANWVHSPAPLVQTTYAQTLSGGQADSITDYTNLRLTFEAAP